MNTELEYYKSALSAKQQHYEAVCKRLQQFKQALENIRDKQVLNGNVVVDLDNELTDAMRNIVIETLKNSID